MNAGGRRKKPSLANQGRELGRRLPPPRASKETLDFEVAGQLALPVATVREVTRSFIDSARAALANDGGLLLTGLGRFSVSRVHVRRTTIFGFPHTRTRVRFSCGRTLSRALKERKVPMEKYAVDEHTMNHEKTASARCPVCGQESERHGEVRMCPDHGSEPFEPVEKA